MISSASPIGSAVATVATFGPPTTPDTEPLGSLPPIPLPAEIPDEQTTATPTGSTTAIVDGGSTTGDQQRAIAVGVAGVVAIAATVGRSAGPHQTTRLVERSDQSSPR